MCANGRLLSDQFTANTMAMVSRRWGLRAAGVGDAARGLFRAPGAGAARRARVTEILADGGPLPRDLVTRKSLENAAAVVAATGGSTNAGLHLPAIAHEAGLRFTLDDIAEVFARTPLLADLQPGGNISPSTSTAPAAPMRCSRRCSMEVICTPMPSRFRAAPSPSTSPTTAAPTARWCGRRRGR